MILISSGLCIADPVVCTQKILIQVVACLFGVSVICVKPASSALAAVDIHFCD